MVQHKGSAIEQTLDGTFSCNNLSEHSAGVKTRASKDRYRTKPLTINHDNYRQTLALIYDTHLSIIWSDWLSLDSCLASSVELTNFRLHL